MHVFGRRPMLFTKPPAQKGAVQISPVQKKVAIFDPLKIYGRADGSPKKDFPYQNKINMLPSHGNTLKRREGDSLESILRFKRQSLASRENELSRNVPFFCFDIKSSTVITHKGIFRIYSLSICEQYSDYSSNTEKSGIRRFQ